MSILFLLTSREYMHINYCVLKITDIQGEFIHWCIPLFGSEYGSSEFNNYTCSFLATNGNMYFINHTAGVWEKDNCCLFETVTIN